MTWAGEKKPLNGQTHLKKKQFCQKFAQPPEK